MLQDDVQVHIQMLWGSIGWATGATFGIALANPKRKTILITGEGSHQLTANEIGNMGRFGANPIILCLNNDGYMVERALEPNPDWSCKDLAKWRYADVPHALGCTDWFTARVETLGELDAALKAARERKSGAYIESHRRTNGYAERPRLRAYALKGIVRRSDLTKQHTHKKEKFMSEVILESQPKPRTKSTTTNSTKTVEPGSSDGSLDFSKLVADHRAYFLSGATRLRNGEKAN